MGDTATARILFIGDIVARPGRRGVTEILPQLKKDQSIDVVVANVENLAGGKGVTEKTLIEMQAAGVDYFTSGNHIFARSDWREILDDENFPIIRPLNYRGNVAGWGQILFELNGYSYVLANLEGVVGMQSTVDNPFDVVDKFLNELEPETKVILDFHAETTSEKRAMGFFVDGRVQIMIGTHTHVPTADLTLLPGGTFYVSDLGMVGTEHSVLGVDSEIIIRRMTETVPEKFVWDYEGSVVFNSVLVELSESGDIVSYKRVDRIIP